MAAGIGAFDAAPTVRGATSHRGIVYAEVPGFRPLLMDVHVPVGASSGRAGPAACVVWVHGGGWEYGDRRFTPGNWPPGYLLESLVAAGLAVATVDYRLSGEAVYPAALHDLKAALRFLRTQADRLAIDPARFGVCGESAGGHLAAMIALTGADPTLEGTVGEQVAAVGPGTDEPSPSSGVQAAAILYGVTDFTTRRLGHPLAVGDDPSSPEARFLGATPQEAPALAIAASPVSWATSSAPPMLLISGDADTIVPLDQSERLRDALHAAGATDVVLVVVPGANHCFEGVDPTGPLDQAIAYLATRLT